MVRCLRLPAAAALLALGFLPSGCGRSIKPRPPLAEPERPSPPSDAASTAVRDAPDPVPALVRDSEARFEAGQRELELGHLDRARAEFDAALDGLLEAPGGSRLDPRLRAHFDRLVDRISAIEASTLAAGDGFTERRDDAASIDDLLAISTLNTPPASLTAAVAVDLRMTAHDVPIPFNPKVLSYVELFQGRLSDWFGECLARGGQYLPMIQRIFQTEGLPLDLAYIPIVESAYKPTARSRASARGVWQFMRGTAVAHGLKQDWYIDERSDPEKATQAAATYLKSLVKMFGGDWHLALASYNGGPGLVQRALKRAKVSDFWTLAEKGRAIPRETREYVPMVLAAMIVARNPRQYGLTVVPEPAAEADRVPVPGPVDLRRVAEWTGTPVETIQQLNPELRRWTTPVRYPGYELKVPSGTGAMLAERLAGAEATELASLQWHVVKKGETLATIANRLKVRRADLAEANYLSQRARVAVGQKLIVPRAPDVLVAARPDRPAPAYAPPAAAAPAAETANSPAGAHATGRRVYSVKPGDTLSSIAQLFRTTVAAIRHWNQINGSLIRPGDRLTIFTSAARDPD